MITGKQILRFSLIMCEFLLIEDWGFGVHNQLGNQLIWQRQMLTQIDWKRRVLIGSLEVLCMSKNGLE